MAAYQARSETAATSAFLVERRAKGDSLREGKAVTAAEKHGLVRASSGFAMEEAFAEYRALRASVPPAFIGNDELP
jgi:hypothetical protein